jgi:Transcriptional regulator containing an amidase domain and an AraC-type DNA-binding HTH domain
VEPPLPDPFSSIAGLGDELRTGPEYHWHNPRRGHADEAVVQQNLSGSVFFEDANGRRLAGPGQALLFTHDEPSHYGYPPEATEPYRLRFVTFRLGALRPWFERLRAEFGPIVKMAPEGEAAAVLLELRRHFHGRSFRDRFHESELLHQLLIALYREQVAASQAHDPVEFGYHYLCDHFRSPVNLKEVAERCGVSREHFIRGFGKRYGEPPGEMLRRLRLEHAHRMLRATQMPVGEVAVACGFADANTFCRAYRLRYGVTPGSVRRG